MPSHLDLDRQIELLMECKPLPEAEVKTLYDQARAILVEEWNDIFDSREIPDMTIQSYLKRIFRYTRAGPSVYIIAYVYIDRFCHNNPEFGINARNVHRLLITTIMVASNLLIKDLPPAEILDVGIKASEKQQFLYSIIMELKNQGLRVLILFQGFGLEFSELRNTPMGFSVILQRFWMTVLHSIFLMLCLLHSLRAIWMMDQLWTLMILMMRMPMDEKKAKKAEVMQSLSCYMA